MLKTRKPSLLKLLFLTAVFLFIPACGVPDQAETALPSPTVAETQVEASEAPPLPTDTPSPSPTASPTATATVVPTSTPSPEPSPSPTPTITVGAPAAVSGNWIVKYLVLPGTGGPVGCGDSLVPVSTGQMISGDVSQDVSTALKSLFSTGGQHIGDLYNALYQSNLSVASVEFKKQTGEITVYLAGGFTKPKDDCEKLRYRAQVWDTIRQFPEIWRAYVWVNDKLLGDLLVVGDN
jgi:hypothetical protein